MSLLRRLSRSPASLTVAASYLAFASTAIWGLVTIPIVVAFLTKEELGLWAVVNAFLQYLVWMDLGIGPATGRMMADSVASRNQIEINRWWTATRAVLFLQGAIIIILGLLLVPLFLRLLDIPHDLHADARWLLIGGILTTGLSLPMRGAPGLLTAQNRFYWVPFLQVFTPWFNLLVFYLLLRKGMGLKAYIWAMAASQALTWMFFTALILAGPDRPRMDIKGIERNRFGRLFKLSGNMTVAGLTDTILNSLPAMLIARLGGLGMVPIYHFSWKGPLLASGLVQRTYQSFYPSLQRLHVTNQKKTFKERHREIGKLTLGIGLIASGLVLAFNTVIVQSLAGPQYYIGPYGNIGFALAMITFPLSGIFRILLLISGDLGKDSIVSLFRLFAVGIFAYLLWKPCGLVGLAMLFALAPLCTGAYGYFRGTRGCGCKAHEISGNIALLALASMALVIVIGTLIGGLSQTGGPLLQLPGRSITLPPLSNIFLSLIPSCVGTVLLVQSTRALFKRRAR